MGFHRGLSQIGAEARLAAEGPNELPRTGSRTPLRIILEVLREPMLALLLGGGIVYLIIGDPVEALMLLAFAGMSVAITVVQEMRTERVLEALRDLTSPRALVIRDGERKRIAGRDVVRGDLVVLGEGDRVPADAFLLQAHDIQADESLLTGESVPVRKSAAHRIESEGARPGGDDQPYVYSGSLVVRGGGIAEVTAVGRHTEIGKIGEQLAKLDTEPPRLQSQTSQIVRFAAVGGGLISLVAVILYGTVRGGWLDAALAGIAIGMSMLPEEFPVVLAVFMAMGAWRISRARVLTRRAAAIETLGSATVLCTDKTGTLTENRMAVSELRLASGQVCRAVHGAGGLASGEFEDLARCGALASAPEPVDPMEKALHDLVGERAGSRASRGLKLLHSYGLRPELLAMTQLWQHEAAPHSFLAAAKGAPEAIAELCRLDDVGRERLRQTADEMAAEGLRVLGVARAKHEGQRWPESQREFQFEFLGLIGLADPLRPSVLAAVEECRAAGVRVVMITGDYPATARAIASQAGFSTGGLMTGAELERLDESELIKRVRSVTVFARIMPEQKLRIVEALKADGQIVAMTGDGVNDAPSLKAAHIGVAMGGRGTDVAREASSLVLLDDDFGSIVKAIRLGRRIYDNLRKAMGFIFAVHVPVAGLALLPLVTGLPIIFSPIHIAYLEMIIDPVCSLAFEAETEEENVMRRPPRQPSEPLFSWPLIAWSVLQGALVLVLVGGIFVVASERGMPDDEVRALTFFSLVFAIAGLIFVNRSFSSSLVTALTLPNPAMSGILLVVAVVLASSLLVPFVSHLFRFGPLHLDDLALTIAAGLGVLVMLELLKPIWRTRLLR